MTQTVTASPRNAADIPLPFRRVLPDDLGALWPFVEPGLETVRAIGQAPWTADDVLKHLIDERAALYVREDAFAVLEQCLEPISGRKYLNVWILWAEPGKALAIRRLIIAWLDAMRLAQGCEWWQFMSPRAGWFGMESGCEPYMTIWRRR